MLKRYIVKTKLPGTSYQHFIVVDTHRDNLPIAVHAIERKAKQSAEAFNRQHADNQRTSPRQAKYA